MFVLAIGFHIFLPNKYRLDEKTNKQKKIKQNKKQNKSNEKRKNNKNKYKNKTKRYIVRILPSFGIVVTI
jgi:hypothetical protein